MLLMTAALFASCVRDNYHRVPPTGDSPIEAQFTTGIRSKNSTRVSDNKWEGTDRIGLFMVPAGRSLDESYAGATNVEMSVTGGSSHGTLTPAAPVYYPETGNVDFVAYYPYSVFTSFSVENHHSIPVSLKDQASAPAREILYSDNATNVAASGNAVALDFGYSLAKLVVTVTAKAGTEFSAEQFADMEVLVDGMFTTAKFSLATGELFDHASQQVLSMCKLGSTETQAVFEALILPVAENTRFTFTFVVDGKNFSQYIDGAYTAGWQYDLNFTLEIPAPPEPVFVLSGATITAREKVSRSYQFKALERPGNLWVSEGTPQGETGLWTMDFNWDAVSGADMYFFELFKRTGQTSEPVHSEAVSQTTVTVNELASGTTYYWRVAAGRGREQTDWVTGAQFTL
jgi:hypothetical protein